MDIIPDQNEIALFTGDSSNLYSSNRGFLKSLRLSPDAKSSLVCTENAVQCIPLSADIGYRRHAPYQSMDYSWSLDDISDLSQLKSKQGESIYDSAWWPHMDSANLVTCCYAISRRDHPIHLMDVTGLLRCSYRMYNQADELESAISLSFNLQGDKIYAGSNRMIRIFDINEPGKSSIAIPTSSSRRASTGQKGLVSALAFNPDYSGAYAAGSYAHNVSVYVETAAESVLEISGLGCGVTHLKWSPCGRYLWIGCRNSSHIACWDMRGTRTEVGRVERPLTTNQRMMFDLDPWGNW